MNTNNSIDTFTPNIIPDCIPNAPLPYPPKNKSAVIVHINIIFPYSPKKKYANDNAECSV